MSSVAARHAGAQRPFWLTANASPRRSPSSTSSRAVSRSARERLLREHVLARRERLPDDRGAHVGVRGDVDDLDLRVAQELVEISEDPLDAELLAHARGRLRPRVVHADDALSVAPVARKVRRPDDAATPDDADARAVVHREGRVVVELGLECALNDFSQVPKIVLSFIYNKTGNALPGVRTLPSELALLTAARTRAERRRR